MFFATMNKDAINILVQEVFLTYGSVPKNGTSRFSVHVLLLYKKVPNLFPKVVVPFFTHTKNVFFTSSTAFLTSASL